MADLYGGTAIPLAVPAPADVFSDPTIQVTLAFLKAFLQADANATAMWNASGVAPGIPVVRSIVATDPSQSDQMFRTNDLPALYMWRGDEQSRIEQVADSWRVETSMLKLLWIPPTTKREISTNRNNIFNGIAKACDIALERCRTPGFTYSGDTDPRSATLGSNIHDITRAVRMRLDGWKGVDIQLINADGSRGERYSALEMHVYLEEKLEPDTTRATQALGGVQITITAPTGETYFVGRA